MNDTLAGASPVDQSVGRPVPKRTSDGTPICPWCEQPVWNYCRSQYDTMTCVWRPLEGDEA
jgi:hypothetical protein